MSWVKKGMRAARRAPDGWQEIGDRLYRQACAERERRVRQLQIEGTLLQGEERERVEQLNATKTRPAHVLRLSLGLGVLWAAGSAFLFVMSYDLIAQTLVVATYGQGRRLTVAGILTLATGIAIERLLRALRKLLPEGLFNVWVLFLTLTPVLCLGGAAVALNLIGGEYEAVQRAVALEQRGGVEIAGTPAQKETSTKPSLAAAFYQRAGRLSNVFRILMALGLELAAALAFHEALERIPGAGTVLWAQWRLQRVRRRIAACAQEIAHWQQEPELRREAFIQGALFELGRGDPERPGERSPLPPGVAVSLGILGVIVLFTLLFVLVVTQAFGQEVVVTAVDLTVSSGGDELVQNVRTVEGIIPHLTPGSRLVVLGVTNRSFAPPPLLDARFSMETGLFGERLQAGQRQVTAVWRERSKTLRADVKGTDLFGVVWKAAVLFQENARLRPSLILLSDGRQVGRGYNFETESGVSPPIVQRVEREGLIPSLTGVKVWILGAHALGISERHWLALEAFWRAYFQQAGAQLVSFSADRRWTP